MKTKTLLTAIYLLSLTGTLFSTTIAISNSGTTFSPASVTIQQGDTVIFNLGSAHNVVEVSQSTWNANGNTSNGGFSLGFGGGQLIFNTTGIFYYVCAPHAAIGMKGVITVSGATGIGTTLSESGKNHELETVYPNPFSDRLTLNFTLAVPSRITIDLMDITGNIVLRIVNNDYNAGKQVENIDLADLKPGQYLVNYHSSRESTVQHLIKVN
jgi:plastocyanin